MILMMLCGLIDLYFVEGLGDAAIAASAPPAMPDS